MDTPKINERNTNNFFTKTPYEIAGKSSVQHFVKIPEEKGYLTKENRLADGLTIHREENFLPLLGKVAAEIPTSIKNITRRSKCPSRCRFRSGRRRSHASGPQQHHREGKTNDRKRSNRRDGHRPDGVQVEGPHEGRKVRSLEVGDLDLHGFFLVTNVSMEISLREDLGSEDSGGGLCLADK